MRVGRANATAQSVRACEAPHLARVHQFHVLVCHRLGSSERSASTTSPRLAPSYDMCEKILHVGTVSAVSTCCFAGNILFERCCLCLWDVCLPRRHTSTGVSHVTMSCCGSKEKAQNGKEEDATYEIVKNYYGKVLQSTKDLKTSACTAAGRPHERVLQIIRKVPKEVDEKFYGCGAPLPLGIDGLTVLDLGSGSGRDCYVCAALVGETGKVVGIDLTDEQLNVAQRHAEGYCRDLGYKSTNLEFVKGHMEYLDRAGIANESIDIIISNCVINLSPDKPRVLAEAYRVLNEGGELYFSDVYSDRRLPKHVQEHELLWGECIAGALYVGDFVDIAKRVGFADPRMLSISEIKVTDPTLKDIVGEAKFYSITYRLFKLPGLLETRCEDYGQFAVYKGTIEGYPHAYQLDDHHKFVTNKPMLVCGNTAAMVGEKGISWLAKHFEVVGERSVHYGVFDCNDKISAAPAMDAACAPTSGGCC